MSVVSNPEIEAKLADAFATFTAAAGQLEFRYQELQKEVIRLRRELEARNIALAESLNENQAMRMALRRILDTLPCGVVVLDDHSRITFSNVEAQRQIEAVCLSNDSGLKPSQLVQQWRAQACETHESEIQVLCADSTRWFAIRSSTATSPLPIKSTSDSTSRHSVLIIRDITQQRLLQEEKESSQHLVALAKMSAILAHEIRNPLGSMELLAGLLFGSDGLTVDQRQWMGGIRAGVRSLTATVNNVLHYHSLGTSNLLPVQLASVLRESVQFVQPLAQQAGIGLFFRDEIGERKIAANPGEIQQVVFNLAINGFRHTAKGGTVTVSARVEAAGSEEVVVVEVADTGSGIAEANLARIFDAGFSTTGHSPGLGLAVCKKIIESHNATIDVTSRLGVGTTFRMEFPLA